jgi:hypothetical protein
MSNTGDEFFQTLIVILVCIFIIFGIPIIIGRRYGTKLFKSSYARTKATLLAFIVLILFIALIFAIPISTSKVCAYEDLDEKYELISEGTWTRVYQKNEDTVIKQFYEPGWGHKNYKHVYFPWRIFGNGICDENCALGTYMVHNWAVHHQRKNVHRRLQYSQKYGDTSGLPWVGNFEPSRNRFEMKYAGNEINATLDQKHLEQLQILNNNLTKEGWILDDMHKGNWRTDSDQNLQAIDGELYTKKEHFLGKYLFFLFDGHQYSLMSPVLKKYNSIYNWHDKRPILTQ